MSQQGMEFQQSAAKTVRKMNRYGQNIYFSGRIHTLAYIHQFRVVTIKFKLWLTAQTCQRSKTVLFMNVFKHLVINLIICTAFKLF